MQWQPGTCLVLQFDFSELDGRARECLQSTTNATSNTDVKVADVMFAQPFAGIQSPLDSLICREKYWVQEALSRQWERQAFIESSCLDSVMYI